MISSSSLHLSRGFYAIFLFLFPHPATSLSCVPLTTLPLNGAITVSIEAVQSYSFFHSFSFIHLHSLYFSGRYDSGRYHGIVSVHGFSPDTLSTKLYQVNTRIGRIGRRQAYLGGFLESSSPPSDAPEDDDDSDNNDDGVDGDASSSSSNEMST